MIVQSLVKRNNKVTVTFEEGEKIKIFYEIAVKFGLRKKDKISDKRLNEILNENELFGVKNSAYRILARRVHSVKEFRQKLLNKKYDKKIVDNVIEDLLAKNYLNDYDFAEKFADERIHRKKNGLLKIKSELIKKGVQNTIISDVLSKYESNEINLENALELAQKKLKSLSNKNLDKLKLKQKLIYHLQSKGFNYSTITEVLNKINLESFSTP